MYKTNCHSGLVVAAADADDKIGLFDRKPGPDNSPGQAGAARCGSSGRHLPHCLGVEADCPEVCVRRPDSVNFPDFRDFIPVYPTLVLNVAQPRVVAVLILYQLLWLQLPAAHQLCVGPPFRLCEVFKVVHVIEVSVLRPLGAVGQHVDGVEVRPRDERAAVLSKADVETSAVVLLSYVEDEGPLGLVGVRNGGLLKEADTSEGGEAVGCHAGEAARRLGEVSLKEDLGIAALSLHHVGIHHCCLFGGAGWLGRLWQGQLRLRAGLHRLPHRRCPGTSEETGLPLDSGSAAARGQQVGDLLK
mmetsp:Transcript_22004/g.61077  ORF Transcript_22004/g.61077 Transcript_22004/m.61077 type:complete len:302 (+) Transcript_22004:484-1389(+)